MARSAVAVAAGSVVAPGSVAVVTGCTRGFGRVLVNMLAERGIKVVVSGIDGSEADELAKHINAAGGTALASVGDVTKPEDMAAIVEAGATLGGIDLWVNNAAYESPGMSPITDLEPGVFEAIQQVNVFGTYRGTMAAVEAMRTRGGVVINITGRGDDLRSAKFTAAYAASKAWIRSFSRSLAAELSDTGVRVIPFNPGIMATTRMSVEDHAPTESVDDRTMKLFAVVNRALGDPPEVAAQGLIDFLGSEPGSLKKELRLLNAGRIAKGLGSEAVRAGSGLLDRGKQPSAN
jgi:NAD(P)-dependent dehydrogenase (short-subunit alcohol dehydrogenase family)